MNSAADLIGRSFVQTNQAVARPVEAGILHQVTVGRRNRAFEAPDIIDAFTDLERQLCTTFVASYGAGVTLAGGR